MGSGFKYPRGFHRGDFPPLQSGDLFHHPKVLLKIQLLKLVVTISFISEFLRNFPMNIKKK